MLGFTAFILLATAAQAASPARTVTMKGNPLALEGPALKVGEAAPGFTAVDGKLSPSAFDPKAPGVKILVAVPSLNTPVCDREARRFNEAAAQLGAGVRTYVISMDLPFAQGAWCAAAGVANLTTLSDHRTADFGTKWGVLLPDLRLLARAVFVVDGQGILRHVEIVPEVTNEPDYPAALAAAKAAIAK